MSGTTTIDQFFMSLKSEQDAQRLAKEKWLREEQKKYLEEDHKRWAARFEAQKKTKDLRSAEKVEKESLKKRIQVTNTVHTPY